MQEGNRSGARAQDRRGLQEALSGDSAAVRRL